MLLYILFTVATSSKFYCKKYFYLIEAVTLEVPAATCNTSWILWPRKILTIAGILGCERYILYHEIHI